MLANSNILSLLDTTEFSDIFENFLNGRFEYLQSQIGKLRLKLKNHIFFSREDIYNKIRSRNLQQFVAPYKVIDIREIA